MSAKSLTFLATLALSFLAFSSCHSQSNTTALFPAGIDHLPWDRLLKKYVNEKGLVDYKAWKTNKDDLATLDTYLAQYANSEGPRARREELSASAANAYNAFAIRSILRSYPTDSIQDISSVFRAKSHNVGGKKISLDQIEKQHAIPTLGPIAHSIVVCCANSCPPLQRTAYTAENVTTLSKQATRDWLAREDLNNFNAGPDKIAISKIFDWYERDFERVGGVKAFLIEYTPDNLNEKINSSQITYRKYDWNLNAQ